MLQQKVVFVDHVRIRIHFCCNILSWMSSARTVEMSLIFSQANSAARNALKNIILKIEGWKRMAGYLGDKKTMIVHHLGNKQKECNIYHVEKIHKQYFTPDLLENAVALGFKPCKWCN